MHRALDTISEELGAGFRHAFILTGNVGDLVWPADNEPSGRPTSFEIALAQRLSAPRDGCGLQRVAALYSVSQGIALFRDGEQVLRRDDELARRFGRNTGLDAILDLGQPVGPEDASRASEPSLALPPLHGFLMHSGIWTAAILHNAEYLIDAGAAGRGAQSQDRIVLDLLRSWATDTRIRAGHGCIALVYQQLGTVPEDLRRDDSGFHLVHVAYPDPDERETFIRGLLAGDSPARASRLANLTTGFRRCDMAEVVNRAMDDRQIAARKADLIRGRCGDVLELVEARYGLDGANAQPHVRDYLRRLRDVVATDRRSPLVPKGLLFVGVPGNGKSHLAQAFAHDCGMNMLRFKNLRGMYVGESERHLETVLDVLPSLAPCVVFIDEVDQMLTRRSHAATDGGVDARLLGRLLAFMGDDARRGDILWIGATNRPDLLDAAMMRRFDRVFPFMNPTSDALNGLIEDLLGQLPGSPTLDLGAAAPLVQHHSCDDVEKIVRRAYETHLSSGDAYDRCFARAARLYKPNHDPVMYELTALLSVRAANFLTDLPWFDEEGHLCGDLPEFLTGYWHLDSGSLDVERIDQRIARLRLDAMTGGVTGTGGTRASVGW